MVDGFILSHCHNMFKALPPRMPLGTAIQCNVKALFPIQQSILEIPEGHQRERKAYTAIMPHK
jgi:hypothetical protein